MRFLPILVCALAVAMLGPRPAAAQDLISVEPRVPAGFPASVRDRLSQQVPARLAAAGLHVRSGADIAVASRAAAACGDAACLRARLQATGARAAARIELRQTDGGFTAILDVVSLSTGQSLAHEEADCGGCPPLAAAEVALSLIDGVQVPDAEPAPPPPTTAVVQEPPLEGDVPPDALEPAQPSRPARRTSPVVWGALGVGVFLAVGSIPLLLLDGDPTCDGPSQTCPNVFDTQAGGIAAAVSGGVLLVSALVMALTGWPPGPLEEVAP